MKGQSLEVEVLEGRPPKILDVADGDENLCRYCLADWVQTGDSAVYTFVFNV